MKISLEDGDQESRDLMNFTVVGKILAKWILNRKGVIRILKGI